MLRWGTLLLVGLALLTCVQDGAMQSLPEGCAPPGFFHGVASGNPLMDAVVIWTRFSPQNENSTDSIPVEWLVGTDRNMSHIAASGNASTGGSRDFTVKVDVRGLQPDTRYWYFFRSANYASPLGTTKTAPPPGSKRPVRFAISSCASWGFGHFNVYNLTSQVRHLDFLLFLGDWIYEYGTEQYPTPPMDPVVRQGLVSEHDTFTLDDYRTRHRLHRTDPQSQELSRRIPIIATWDDHDLADNAWANGSLDQDRATQAGVSYQQRKQNAVQAFYEYLPVRDPPQHPASLDDLLHGMYRTFQFGDIATLVTTDQRFLYRTEPVDQLHTPYVQALQSHDPDTVAQEVPNLEALRADYYRQLASPDNVLIGDEQLSHLTADFNASVQQGVTWQLYADQASQLAGLAVPEGMAFQQFRAQPAGKEHGPSCERRTPDVQQAIRDIYSGLAEAALGRLLDVVAGQLADIASTFGQARVLVSAGTRHDALLTDGWDGYVYERDQVLDLFQMVGAAGGNPVSLAGDSHNAWAFELPSTSGGQPAVAVEFCTASVTPPGLERGLGYVPGVDLADVMVRGMYISNPSQRYAQIKNRGVAVLNASKEAMHAEFWFVDKIDSREYESFCDRAFDVQAGQPGRLLNSTCTAGDQLLYRPYSQDDPLQGYALFQPARNELQIATSCPTEITNAGPATASDETGIVQRVGSAIAGFFG